MDDLDFFEGLLDESQNLNHTASSHNLLHAPHSSSSALPTSGSSSDEEEEEGNSNASTLLLPQHLQSSVRSSPFAASPFSPGTHLLLSTSTPTPLAPASASAEPTSLRSTQERFGQLVKYAEVVASSSSSSPGTSTSTEIIPLGRNLVVQLRMTSTTEEEVYVTRKAVYVPNLEDGGLFFQSPNVRHLCGQRARRSSDHLSSAALIVLTATSTTTPATKRRRRRKDCTLLDAALRNTLRLCNNTNRDDDI